MEVLDSRTELDSHANMVVFGRNSIVIAESGRYAEVNPFTPDLDSLKRVPIVDAAIAYDCPYSLKTYILVARNVLHVPTMEHNLVPPFIMREAGLEVNEIPKIHDRDPTVETHSIYIDEISLRIPLQLWGIFSYFTSRKPQLSEIETSEIAIISPDAPEWNPHSDVWSRNEEGFLDWKGEIIERSIRDRVLFDTEADIASAVMQHQPSSSYGNLENAHIDSVCVSSIQMAPTIDTPDWDGSASYDDPETAVLDNISNVYNPRSFAECINERAGIGKFQMSIGSTTAYVNHDDDELFCDEPIVGRMTLADVDAAHANPPKGVTAKDLAKVWRIDVETARKTLQNTTQLKKQDGNNTLSRNFSTNDRMLRYNRIKSFFFTDTFFVTGKAKSLRGNTCMQIFVSDLGFVYVVPMRSKGEFPLALKEFAKEVGVPEALIVDPSGEQSSKEVRRFCQQIGTTLRILEEHTQWANRAELYIGLIKEAVRKDMLESNSPIVLWDYCAERRARINNLTAKDLFQLHGSTPHTLTTGNDGDISNLCQFNWYEWCYFRQQKESFPYPKEVLGRVLGPSRNVGNEMAQWVLQANGKVVCRRSLRKLKSDELNNNEVELYKRQIFDQCIKEKLGDSMQVPTTKPKSEATWPDDDSDDGELDDYFRIEDEDPVDASGLALSEQPLFDHLVHAEVALPQGEEMQPARVVGHSRDIDGNVIGTHDDNPILNTIVYDVEFPDGMIRQYSANVIAENMYSQVDSEGYQFALLDSIIDYDTDERAVTKSNMYVVTKRGRRRMRKTTVGWKLLVRWKDGSENWFTLAEMKESNPIEVAEFAVARGIQDEPAFSWWVPYTLKKRDRIVSAVTSRIRKAKHKYGIEVPSDIKDAIRIDEKNGNSLWQDAIKKEMYNVSIAFQILQEDENLPPGWIKASGHLVFDVKMDFTRKARWVKDGHKTPDPPTSNYAGVVTRESVRIAFTYAALNGLPITAADIRNAYLQAPSSEKHYIICGPEFGLENVGKRALIRRALYGGKMAGRDYWNHMRSCMEFLEFKTCIADPDVWMRKAKKADGSTYWEYVLLYVDDALVISEHGNKVLHEEIGKYFELKEESVGPPSIYLGGKVSKIIMDNGAEAWSFSSSQYVQAAVSNVETYLSEKGEKLPAKALTPLSSNYRPEIDTSSELGSVESAYYQSLIGILRWMVELGRVDICCEVSMMSSCMALPRQGHLRQLFHIFGYLKSHHNAEMVFDPSEPEIDMQQFERQEWASTAYGLDLQEELPPNMPKERGMGMVMRAFVDADHAGDSVTRRSRTGFLIYLNSAPIYWLSKKQTSIETSSFGSEFTAMKQCVEYIRGLRYRLRMMGISIIGPTYVYGDNQSVLANTTIPHSNLKKKSNSIAYHFVREGCARDEWRTTYLHTSLNPADLLTKPLASGEKRTSFVNMIVHHIFDHK